MTDPATSLARNGYTAAVGSLIAKVFSRGLPVVIASTFLHVGVAAALVVSSSSGHKAPPTTLLEVDVDVTDVVPAPVPEPIEAEEEEAPPTTPVKLAAQQPTHVHPYDVPPSHDAHPHDPSVKHDATDHQPAEAPPVISAPSTAPEMPRFTIALGNNEKPTSGNVVATNASGSGAASLGGGEGAAAAAVVPESAVSTPAKLVSSVIAAYPIDARQNEVEADVPVEIVVDSHGAVIEARLVRHAGSGFDESALAAIKRYRFTPAQRDGRVVSVRMRWSVQFRLR